MTATNVFVTPDAIHLFSDGTVLDPAGNLIGSASKVFALPQAQTVVGVAGTTLLRFSVEANISAGVDSFEDVVRRLPSLAEATRNNPETMLHGQFLVIAAGWSAKAEAFRAVAMTGVDGSGFFAFQPRPVDRFCAPSDFRLDGMAFDPARAEESGIKIMEYQRRGGQITATGPRYSVGCFIQHTLLTRDAITTKIIHRWPDEIGSQIRP